MCRLIWMITLSLVFLFIPSELKINALQNPTLTLEAPNLPSFDDQEFKDSSIRIETFGRDSCPYCQILKNNLYRHLDFTQSITKITARYYNLDHPKIKAYFEEIEEKFNFDENLKGAIPATLINGTYLILGYNEASTPKYIDLINRIAKGETIEEDSDEYLYVIKSEFKNEAESLYFPLNKTTNQFRWITIAMFLSTSFCVTGLIIYSRQSKKIKNETY